MKAFKILISVILCMFVVGNALSAETVTRSSGHLMVGEDTTLMQEWVTVHHDGSIPAVFDITFGGKTGGIYIIYDGTARQYQYEAHYFVAAKEDLSAIKIKFLIFNVWGDLIKNLSVTDVADVDAGVRKSFSRKWYASENDVREYYASIAYIARVRTKSGRIIDANTKTILKEARKFSKKFSKSDLESQPASE